MSTTNENPLVDASLRAVDKKRATRDAALAELSKMIQYDEATNASLNVIVDRIGEAIMKGVDINSAALALCRVVMAVPESNAFGPVAEKLMIYIRDHTKSWDVRAPLAMALGCFAVFTGHYSEIFYALPTQITDTLFALLTEAVSAHAPSPVLRKLITALNLACLGLETSFLAGWVYNKYVPLLILTIIYHPGAYAAPATLSPVYHALSLLILAKQASEMEVIDTTFRVRDTAIYGKSHAAVVKSKGKTKIASGPAVMDADGVVDAVYAPCDEEEQDDEYYYDAEVHIPAIRLSIAGIMAKLRALASGEIEVVHGDVHTAELEQFIACLEEVVKQEPVPELNPLCVRPKDGCVKDAELFIHDIESRCLYFSLVEVLKPTLPQETGTGKYILSGEVEKNPFLQNLLCVDEEEQATDGRRKDLEFLLQRKQQRKRQGVIVSESRRNKHEARYGDQE